MDRNLWIDYLRTFIIVLVVAHHAALAYTSFSLFDTQTYINSTAPVVNEERLASLDYLVGYNDIFFMPLMFLISGLFVLKGIIRKTTKVYLTDRIHRLGIPFALAVTFIIPIAYIPSYFLATNKTDVFQFALDYLFHQAWPVGPPWFVWILLLFNIIAVIIYKIKPSFFSSAANAIMGVRKPVGLLFAALILLCLSYIPLSLYVGHYKWTGLGPFDFQLNRIIFYMTFFLVGVCLGGTNWETRFFPSGKLFNVSWIVWLLLSFAAFGLSILINNTLPGLVTQNKITEWMAVAIGDIAFITASVLSCCLFLSFFRQKVNSPSHLLGLLSDNAYGIYLIHYIFITWIQFALLDFIMHPAIKFIIVFSGSLILSFVTVYNLRKISWFRKVI